MPQVIVQGVPLPGHCSDPQAGGIKKKSLKNKSQLIIPILI